MTALKVALVAVTCLAGLAWASPASAYGSYRFGFRSHWYGPSIGLYYGGPYGWGAPGYYGPAYGYGYPPGYVYAPPGIVTPAAGIVYIERSEPPATPQPVPPAAAPAAPPSVPPAASQWWYLCAEPRGTYPQVRECPAGWERVPAVPPGPVR